MSQRFFQQINYSSNTEDSAAEIRALQLKDGDETLCVTGSGARPLDLLVAAATNITSVDFCPAQNHLLRLKLVAFQQLNYIELREFFGIHGDSTSHDSRLEVFERLSDYLPEATRAFWKKNPKNIRNGILYSGTWEKLLRFMSHTTWLRRRRVRELLACSSVDEQREYWQKHWTGWQFRSYLRALSTRFLWTTIIREPGAKLIPRDFDVANYLHNCLSRMAEHSLLRRNPYANLLFFGRYTPECVLPHHLREENFELVRSRVANITVVDSSLDSLLTENERRWDAFSLSDFSSYAPPDAYADVWHGVHKAGKFGARFCERLFLVKRELNGEYLVRDKALEEDLAQLDHTCLYSFHAGTVKE